MFLVVGLLCGGAIGYTLRGAVGSREEGGVSQGAAEAMGGAGAPAGQMPPEVASEIQRYRAALAKDPDDFDANVGLGNLLFDSSQWQKAIEHYERALQKKPQNPDVRVDMAVAYHNLGQDQRAREEMERVTRENPTHRNAWLNLGVVTANLGDRPAAIRAWQRYLELEPSGPHSDAIRAQLEELKRGS